MNVDPNRREPQTGNTDMNVSFYSQMWYKRGMTPDMENDMSAYIHFTALTFPPKCCVPESRLSLRWIMKELFLFFFLIIFSFHISQEIFHFLYLLVLKTACIVDWTFCPSVSVFPARPFLWSDLLSYAFKGNSCKWYTHELSRLAPALCCFQLLLSFGERRLKILDVCDLKELRWRQLNY